MSEGNTIDINRQRHNMSMGMELNNESKEMEIPKEELAKITRDMSPRDALNKTSSRA